MATIRATCSSCGDVEMTTADVWVHIREEDRAGTYQFRCPSCATLVVKPAEPHIIDLLVASGVAWSTSARPAELDEVHDGPAIDHDDLIQFHQLLQTDDWFDELLREDRGR